MSIKVLLVNDVEKLGWFGDVVDVADGYARNYLLPQGLGVIPTEVSLKSLEDEKQKRAKQRKTQRGRLEETISALKDAEVVIAATANEQGHLFGSIGPSEIAANLRQQGLLPEKPTAARSHTIVFEENQLKITDDAVQMSERIKQVGTSQVKIKLGEDLAETVSVVVVPQGNEAGALSPESENTEQADGDKSAAQTKEIDQPTEQS